MRHDVTKTLRSRSICLTETVLSKAQSDVAVSRSLGVLSISPDLDRVVDREVDREQDLQTGEPTCAHIVKTEPGESAQAKVLEARIYGTPLEALCGHVWVPSRDPKSLPLCEECKAIYDMYRMMNDRLNERPSE